MITLHNFVENLRQNPESCAEFISEYDSFARSRYITVLLSHNSCDAAVTGRPVDEVPTPQPAPGWDTGCADLVRGVMPNVSDATIDYLSGRRGETLSERNVRANS